MLGVVMAKASLIWPTVRSRSLSISRMRRRVGSRRALKRRFKACIIRQLSKLVSTRVFCLPEIVPVRGGGDHISAGGQPKARRSNCAIKMKAEIERPRSNAEESLNVWPWKFTLATGNEFLYASAFA